MNLIYNTEKTSPQSGLEPSHLVLTGSEASIKYTAKDEMIYP